ncbi:MAG TPA: hypothetical protein VJB08_05070 [Candidatus Nanoarchaeia archaeon]|nr:hypothetical protein [Candidatus Nanoarchaeia archaeon]
MKVRIISKSAQARKKFQKALQAGGIKESNRPDIIISLGGDGTFLYAERKYPGIPKFLYRDQSICNTCSNADVVEMVKLLKDGDYTIDSHKKIRATLKGKSWLAVNDIILRNEKPNEAIRFSVFINGKEQYPNMIGDGIVVATPFGSAAYFKSITKWSFGKGLGIAFNNVTSDQPSVVVQDSARITFRLDRGSACLAADNNPSIARLSQGDSVKIQPTNHTASIIRTKWEFR